MPRTPTERPRRSKKPAKQNLQEAVVVDVVVKTEVKIRSGQKQTIYPAEALEMIRDGHRNDLQKLKRRGYSWEIKDNSITIRRKLGAVTAIEIKDAPMIALEQNFDDSPFDDLEPEPDFEPLALPATATPTFSGGTDSPFERSVIMGQIEVDSAGGTAPTVKPEPTELRATPPPPPPLQGQTSPPMPLISEGPPTTAPLGTPALVKQTQAVSAKPPVQATDQTPPTEEDRALAGAETPKFGIPAVASPTATPDEAPTEKSFAEEVHDLQTRVDAFVWGSSEEEKLDDLLEKARQLSDISGTLRGYALVDANLAIATLGQLHSRLDSFRRRTAPRTRAERSATPAYFNPGAEAAEPEVRVTALEAKTATLQQGSVQAAELARIEKLKSAVSDLEARFRSLNKQARDLLEDKPASSGADVPTIIESCETLQKDVSDLLKSLATEADPNKVLIGRLKTLNSTIEGLLLSLRHKQQNGREEQAFQGKPLRKTIGLIATAVAAAIGLTVIAVKTCKDNKLLEQKEELEIPEVLATSVPPAPAPVSSVPANAPDTSSPTPATEPDLNLDPVGAEQPAQKTATFNCEIDTKGQEGIKCVDQNAPDANVIEELKWTGEYNSATQTVPAELVLTTLDGQQFKASFDAQIGTRQELSWTLEAIE